jgi:outer membrane protein TolC
MREDERLEESSRQAAAARQLAEQRYVAGLEDYITVLESQRREFTAEAAALAVRRQRLGNRVDLYLALGGGYLRPDATVDDHAAPPEADARRDDDAIQASASPAMRAGGRTP